MVLLRVGTLLATIQCIGQVSAAKNDLASNGNSAEVEKSWI